jgi:hypothetical protein
MISRTPAERRVRFLLVGLPLGMTALLLGSVGALWLSADRLRPAKGEPATITWSSACAEAWVPVANERAQLVGLGDLSVTSQGDQVVVKGVMPGLDDDATAIPALLTAPGELAVYAAESVTDAPEGRSLVGTVDVTSAYFTIGFSGHPLVELQVQPNALDRMHQRETTSLVYTVDGFPGGGFYEEEGSGPDKIEIQPQGLMTKEAEVRMATDWLIWMTSGPAPCPAEALEDQRDAPRPDPGADP